MNLLGPLTRIDHFQNMKIVLKTCNGPQLKRLYLVPVQRINQSEFGMYEVLIVRKVNLKLKTLTNQMLMLYLGIERKVPFFCRAVTMVFLKYGISVTQRNQWHVLNTILSQLLLYNGALMIHLCLLLQEKTIK